MASFSSTLAASTPPKVRTHVAPSPLGSSWLAVRYIRVFAELLFHLNKKHLMFYHFIKITFVFFFLKPHAEKFKSSKDQSKL